MTPEQNRRAVVTALGIVQILAWGSSFYFPAVFAAPIVAQTGWSLGWVVGGTSLGLLIAGLISPRVGQVIDRRGGRPVLILSSILNAIGLAGIGAAPTLPVYLCAWIVLGCGMGTGLYDAVFATLGRLYGKDARAPITTLTLFGGFASTICWPLSAFLIETAGWRGACFVYAALHVSCLPLQLFATRAPAVAHLETAQAAAPGAVARLPHETLIFALLAIALSLAAGIGAIVVVHLIIFLQARGIDFATAVMLGTLLGPAQVAARLIERAFGAHYHPIWTLIAAGALMAAGLLLLAVRFPFAAGAIVLYAAGYGISWVVRGTLPLALFGPRRFPVLMGRLAFPSLIVQALAPSGGALVVEFAGVEATVVVLTAAALINAALIGALWSLCRGIVAPARPA
jgi:MFS family permease